MYYIVFIWAWFENETAIGAKIEKFNVFKHLKHAEEYSLSIPEETTIECFERLDDFIDFLDEFGYFIEV